MSKLTVISGLFIGKVEKHWPDKPESAIDKQFVSGSQKLGFVGFEEDSQADLTVHGGREKAVHHYSAEHYDFWKKKFPEFAHRFSPGGFGENISTTGMDEKNLCIGDILELGTAVVQISQGRQPCWKLNAHIGNNKMVAHFQKSGFTGWYYRVLEVGEVKVGDVINLVERPNEDWPLEKVINARFNRNIPHKDAESLASLPQLANGWRKAFDKKMDPSYQEDTKARVVGDFN